CRCWRRCSAGRRWWPGTTRRRWRWWATRGHCPAPEAPTSCRGTWRPCCPTRAVRGRWVGGRGRGRGGCRGGGGARGGAGGGAGGGGRGGRGGGGRAGRRARGGGVGSCAPRPPLSSESAAESERLREELGRRYAVDVYHDGAFLPHVGLRSPKFACHDHRLFE